MVNEKQIVIAENDGAGPQANCQGITERPALTLDVEKYQFFLDESDLSEAEKREFLETLWSIIVGFVDLGFGVHPLQQACGQFDQKSTEVLAFEAATMIGSDSHSNHTINTNRAMDNDDSKAERKET